MPHQVAVYDPEATFALIGNSHSDGGQSITFGTQVRNVGIPRLA